MKINVKIEKKIIIIAGILLSAVYLSLVWNNNVWMDEAFTASLVHTDFAGVIRESMNDTLPPLYNIILKLSTNVFGYTIPVMKITSVIPMILTVLIGATTVRKRFGLIRRKWLPGLAVGLRMWPINRRRLFPMRSKRQIW